MKSRLVTGLAVVVLLAVGFLLGSFWLQWRRARLGEGATPSEIRQTPVTLPSGFSSRVRVEVLNGVGEKGAAERAASRLRAMGFDVVYYGNAPSFDHRKTEVMARTPDPSAARRVADSLGVDSVISKPDTSLYLDATVVLGKDWRHRLAGSPGAARAGVRGQRGLLERIFGGPGR